MKRREKLVWRGKQWQVTSAGVKCLDGKYDIHRSRVHEDDWESHMREKGWVWMTDFNQAITVARQCFDKNGNMNKEISDKFSSRRHEA